MDHVSAHSLVTGPLIADPFISPFGLAITPALSSKQIHVPSGRRHVLRWRMITAGWTFLRRSGLPFLTVQRTISPTEALGYLFKRPDHPLTAMMLRFFAPELQQQLIRAPTGTPQVILNLLPDFPALPKSGEIEGFMVHGGNCIM